MSAIRPIKITGALTRVMKRNNGDSKVNIIFSLFSRKKNPLAGFALLLLIDSGTLLKRPPAVLLLDAIFFPSDSNNFMSSKCPPRKKHWCRRLFCCAAWRSDQRSPADKIARLTLDVSDWCQMWPWNPTGVVVHLILLATVSGCLFSVVKRPAMLEEKSL